MQSIIELILGNKLLIAVATFSFFAIKGLAWLIVPALWLKYRNRCKRPADRICEGAD